MQSENAVVNSRREFLSNAPSKQRTDHLNVLLITQRSRVQIRPRNKLPTRLEQLWSSWAFFKGSCSIFIFGAAIVETKKPDLLFKITQRNVCLILSAAVLLP